MKIIKFGGKSLSNEKGLTAFLKIIKQKNSKQKSFVLVVSARGNTTNQLENILEKARNNSDYKNDFEELIQYQKATIKDLDLSLEINTLDKIFKGVQLLKDYSKKIKDEVLAQGELMSVKFLEALLKKESINAIAIDAREFIKTDSNFGEAQPNIEISYKKTKEYFHNLSKNIIPIITGFIASNDKNETTTLGRNGSNYSASLIANFLNAKELQNYTHVNGIYTANPDLVSNAKKITQLSYDEANELANFGASILHDKTILPLIEKKIKLRILNTFNLADKGTLISSKTHQNGIKSISVQNNKALIIFKGRGLLGKIGIDARVFNTLNTHQISIGIISQGSSERGMGFIIDQNKGELAVVVLKKEFKKELQTRDVSDILVKNNVSVISIIGQVLNDFHKPFNALIKNQITPLLFSNTVTGKNVSIVVKKEQLNKAVHVIHGQIFGISKKINIAVFGKGTVGETFINQILDNKNTVLKRKNVDLNIFAISNSKKTYLKTTGINKNWEKEFKLKGKSYTIKTIIDFAKKNHLENLIAVDNTADFNFIDNYIPLVQAGFDLVSSNKIANTVSFDFYKDLRNNLTKHKKNYLYETNVGAGLPLIDTINLLHASGENITKIRGVFSGSLSYIFNRFHLMKLNFLWFYKKQ